MFEKLLHNRGIISLMFVLLFVAACSAEEAVTSTPTVTPTPFPTFAYSEPTLAPAVATAAAIAAAQAAEQAEIQLDPQMVERGRDRYVALECGACHGEDGEGSDDAPTLVGYGASEADFIDFMRTGGAMGLDHRFPTESLSNSGIRNLYQYLLSLSSE